MRRILLFLIFLVGCGPAAWDPFRYAPAGPRCWWEPRSVKEYPVMDCTPTDACFPDPDEALSVIEVIDLALLNSIETKKTWSESLMAAGFYGESLAANYPEIDLQGEFEALRKTSFFGGSNLLSDEFRRYGPFLSLSYILFDWGTTRAKNERARRILLSLNWRHDRSIQKVIETVANDYYTYVASMEQVVASLANLEDAAVALDATEQKHRHGIADLSDVLNAKTQVAKREVQVLDNEKSVENNRATLLADMSLPADGPIKVQTDFQPLCDPLIFSQEEYIEQAYVTRPDLMGLYSMMEAAEEHLRVAERQQLGSFNVNSDVGRSYFNQGLSDNYDYSAKLNLEIPIFKGYYYQNKIREAKANILRAQAEADGLKINIAKEVVTAYQDHKIAGEKVEVTEEYVEVATESYKSTLSKYKAGVVDFTTLVNAMSNLADARNSLVSAKKDWFTSLVQLAYATGTLGRPE